MKAMEVDVIIQGKNGENVKLEKRVKLYRKLFNGRPWKSHLQRLKGKSKEKKENKESQQMRTAESSTFSKPDYYSYLLI